MKAELTISIKEAILAIGKENNVDLSAIKVHLKENKDKEFGDFSSNIAMISSKQLSKNPKDIAGMVIEKLNAIDSIKKIEIAGPGFINFFIKEDSRSLILDTIYSEGDGFGLKTPKENEEKILIEYVSSNPTGPLHIGHGRGAAFGSVLASLLRANGKIVDEEYYVNDYGRQMDILALSVWLRCLELNHLKLKYPRNCYQGTYVQDIAKTIFADSKVSYLPETKGLVKALKKDKDPDLLIDEAINIAKKEIPGAFSAIKTKALQEILSEIKEDLKEFGVNHNLWFNESSLFEKQEGKNKIEKALDILSAKNFIYEKEGATWFKSKAFGDDKDRVITRGNDNTTYFASDISYHLDKYERDYDRIINIWGSDHHGYLPRVKASIEALGKNQNKLEVVFIQFANLLRSGKKVSMSTREGEFITLKELIKEVGSEATRFFYINRKGDQHLDFDLDLAKEQSKDNPLYYIQYAHARICSVFKKLNKKQEFDKEKAKENSYLLNADKELDLQKKLSAFPETIERAGKNLEPHTLCYYLKDLASLFHSYYNDEKIISENLELMQSRLLLINATRQVLKNGLNILGISAPESM